jgi:hypothetical protein
MSHQFGPSLMQVTGTTRVSRQQAVTQIGMSMVVLLVEIVPLPCKHDLVGLLEILARSEIIGHMRGKRIVCNSFKAVHHGGITQDGDHLLQAEHQLNHRAQFDPLGGIGAMQRFIAAIHTLWLTMELGDI